MNTPPTCWRSSASGWSRAWQGGGVVSHFCIVTFHLSPRCVIAFCIVIPLFCYPQYCHSFHSHPNVSLLSMLSTLLVVIALLSPLLLIVISLLSPPCCHPAYCHSLWLFPTVTPHVTPPPSLRCSGYKFLYDFLIEMDSREGEAVPEKKEEAQNATHQMMNLLFNLCFQGYVDLHPTITEPGPYQDANFQVPIAAGGGKEWERCCYRCCVFLYLHRFLCMYV